MKVRRKKSAFTLIELLVVIVIIGILATIGVASYNGMRNKAENVKALAAASNAKKQILAAVIGEGKTLTAYYTFEDDDVADPLVDRSGSNNTIPLRVDNGYSASNDTAGGGGKSLRLEKATTFRREETVGVNNGPGPAEKLTISLLFKVDTFHIDNPVAAMNQIFGSDRTAIIIDLDQSLPYPKIAFKNSSTPFDGTSEIKEGRWYHVLASFEESTDTLRIYLNGKLEFESTNYTGSIFNDFQEIWAGNNGPNKNFEGWIDEVIIAPVAVELK